VVVGMLDTVEVDNSVFVAKSEIDPNSAESNSATTSSSPVMGMSHKLDSSQEVGRLTFEGSYTVDTFEGIFHKSDKTPPEVARFVVVEEQFGRAHKADSLVDKIRKNMQLEVTRFAEEGEGMVRNVDIFHIVGILYTVGK